MSSSIVLTGNVIIGPAGAGDCGFPSSITNITFSSMPSQKPAAVSTGAQAPSINSPGSYTSLAGVGSTVGRANFLYLRTTAGMKFRLTQYDKDGGADIVAVVEVSGVLIMEFPTTGELKLLEAQGVGTVEYVATGNS